MLNVVNEVEAQQRTAWAADETVFQAEQLRVAVGRVAGTPDMTLAEAVRVLERKTQEEQDAMAATILRACAAERDRRMMDAVCVHSRLEMVAPGMGPWLVGHALTDIACSRAWFERCAAIEAERQRVTKHLKSTHSILGRGQNGNAWLDKQVEDGVEKHITATKDAAQQALAAHLDAAIELAAGKPWEVHLRAARHLHTLDTAWLRENCDAVRVRLKKEVVPAQRNVVTLCRRIWQPKNWLVTRRTESGRVQYFLYSKDETLSMSTGYFGWRLAVMLMSMYTWLNNVIFWLMVSLFFGPLSVQALFRFSKYTPDKVVDRDTGELRTNEDATITPMMGYLWWLYSSIASEREKFESRDDAGMLGKSCELHLFRLFHYVFRGGIGTLCILVCFPIACFANVALCLVLLLSALAWVPCVSVLAYVVNFVLFDWRHPHGAFSGILPIVSLILYGYMFAIAQLVLSLGIGLVGAPVLSLVIAIFSTLRHALTCFWDSLCFCCVVRPYARQPYVDTCVARRVKGPGMASTLRYHLPPQLVIVLLHAKLEQEELQLWRANHEVALREPSNVYQQWVQDSLFQFMREGSHISDSQVEADTSRRMSMLEDMYNVRMGALGQFSNLAEQLRRCSVRVGQPAADLTITTSMATALLKQFVPRRILSRKASAVALSEYWSSADVTRDDWGGMARHYLRQLFQSEFLTPFEEQDKSIKLEVQHLNFGTYAEVIVGSRTDDLDKVKEHVLLSRDSDSSQLWSHQKAPLNAQRLVPTEGSVSVYSVPVRSDNSTLLHPLRVGGMLPEDEYDEATDTIVRASERRCAKSKHRDDQSIYAQSSVTLPLHRALRLSVQL